MNAIHAARSLTLAALIAFTVLTPSCSYAQAPGVVNGTLVNPAAYVGSLIDFGAFVPCTLEDCSALVGELARIRPLLNACNLHLQNEARGDYRARIFLPPTEFDHAVDIYDFGGTHTWVWVDRGGPWAPPHCSLPTPEPVPPPVTTPPPPIVLPPPPVTSPGPAAATDPALLAAIDRLTAAVNEPGFIVKIGKFLTNKFVLPWLTAAGTCAATQCWETGK